MQVIIRDDNGVEVELDRISAVNLVPGDVLIYKPATPLTISTCNQLMRVVDFLEKSFEGIKVLMIPAEDKVEVMRKHEVESC